MNNYDFVKSLPINKNSDFIDLGIKKNCIVKIRTGRGFSYRAQTVGRRTAPVKLSDIAIKLKDDKDEFFSLYQCEFVGNGTLRYYNVGDTIEIYRMNPQYSCGKKIGDFKIVAHHHTFRLRVKYPFDSILYYALALGKK